MLECHIPEFEFTQSYSSFRVPTSVLFYAWTVIFFQLSFSQLSSQQSSGESRFNGPVWTEMLAALEEDVKNMCQKYTIKNIITKVCDRE